MKGISDSLAIVGALVSTDDLISSVLIGLDRNYLAIASVIQGKNEIEWEKFQALLLRFETTLEQYNIALGINSLVVYDSHSVNAAEVKSSGSKSSTSGTNTSQQS
ncbi:hypothetical protein Sjap_011365 [Stephania japonica]|uniref:Uncharacterized protein n=1 Tax=Stephania japonica TaxID=461633 RepID=A0AAP0JDD2_9MAGN